MTADHVAMLITDACALLDDPRGDAGTFLRLATLRVELLEAGAHAGDAVLADDCCEVAAQLEARLAALEESMEVLATPA